MGKTVGTISNITYIIKTIIFKCYTKFSYNLAIIGIIIITPLQLPIQGSSVRL